MGWKGTGAHVRRRSAQGGSVERTWKAIAFITLETPAFSMPSFREPAACERRIASNGWRVRHPLAMPGRHPSPPLDVRINRLITTQNKTKQKLADQVGQTWRRLAARASNGAQATYHPHSTIVTRGFPSRYLTCPGTCPGAIASLPPTRLPCTSAWGSPHETAEFGKVVLRGANYTSA